MFKRFILILAICFIASAAQAEPISLTDTLKNIPLSQGVAYSIKDSEFNHISTAVLVQKWGFGVEVGYVDSGKAIGLVSYKLLDAKQFIDIPILKELEFRPGVYAAIDELDTSNAQWDWGVSASLLTIQW